MASQNRNKRKNTNDNNQPPPKKRRTNSTQKQETLKKIKSKEYSLLRKNKKKHPSKTWDHALVIHNESNEEIGTKCKHCNQIYSVNTSSSSWNTHLLTTHKIDIKKESKNQIDKSQTTLFQHRGQVVKFNAKDKEIMKDAAVKFVVLDLRPFLAATGDGFDYATTAAYNLGVQKGIKCKSLKASGVLSDRTTVSRAIVDEYAVEKKKCVNEFQTVLAIFPPPIHGTTDCSEFKAKKNGEKVMGVTVHYAVIDIPSVKLAYLKCSNFKQSVIEILNDEEYQPIPDPDEEIDEISDDENVPEWDDMAYSSDDGDDEDDDIENKSNDSDDDIDLSGNFANIRNILKYAFHEFELDELLNIDKNIKEIKELVPEIDETRIDRFRNAISTDNHSANKKAFGNDENDKCNWLMVLILCFNHNWSLVIQWMIKNVKKKHKALRRLIRLIKRLIKRIKKSNLMGEYDPTLKAMIEARWEGIYECLKSIVAGTNYETLNKHCVDFGRRDLMIRIVKDNLKELTAFFKQIVFIHKHFEYMHIPRIQNVIPWIHYILFNFTIPKANEYSLVKKLKKEMNKQTLIRVVPKLSFHHWYATLFNPKTRHSLKKMLNGVTYKHLWTGETITIHSEQLYNDTILEIKKDLKFIECVEKYKQIKLGNINANSNVDEKDNESEEDVDLNDVTSMLSEFNTMFEEELNDINNDDCELERYLNKTFSKAEIKKYDENLLLLWNTTPTQKEFPSLGKLAVFHIIKQPASSPSEFLFSLSNNIVSYKRSRLSYHKVNLMTFLVSRWKLN